MYVVTNPSPWSGEVDVFRRTPYGAGPKGLNTKGRTSVLSRTVDADVLSTCAFKPGSLRIR